jgi:hypothetical protein
MTDGQRRGPSPSDHATEGRAGPEAECVGATFGEVTWKRPLELLLDRQAPRLVDASAAERVQRGDVGVGERRERQIP